MNPVLEDSSKVTIHLLPPLQHSAEIHKRRIYVLVAQAPETFHDLSNGKIE